MRAWFISLLDKLRDGFWLLPGLMATAAVLLGVTMPWVDGEFPELRGRNAILETVLFGAGPEGARAVLAAIAGSSITVAATVFSITIAILALTSQQYGPRLLRTFTRHRGVQFALGMFIASFLYPLIVLRTVRDGQDNVFVPQISVTLGVLLAVTSTGVLIYFIDLLSKMIRAPYIIDMAGHDLDDVADERIPPDASRGDSDEECEAICEPGLPTVDDPPALLSDKNGYVTVIVMKALIEHAASRDTAYRLAVMPGDYVHEGMPLLYRRPGLALDEEDIEALRGAFNIGNHRTTSQDLSFCVNQLAEVALRAISPSINDPFTAQNCIHRLTATLTQLAERPFPDPRHHDGEGRLRLLSCRPTFAYLVAHAYAPIRRYARSDAQVLGSIFDALGKLARHCPPDRPLRLRVVRQEADATLASISSDVIEQDRLMLEKAFEQFKIAADHAAGTWGRCAD